MQKPKILLAGLIALGAAGCAPDVAKWSPVETSRRLEVSQVRTVHTALVDRRNGELAPGERLKLERFIAAQDRPYALHVALRGNASRDHLGRVAEALVELGVEPHKISVVADQPNFPGLPGAVPQPSGPGAAFLQAVQLTVDSYVVAPPGCPDWSQANADSGNRGSSYLGCSNLNNLGLMIADPRDLVHGQGSEHADGEPGANAVGAYRAGKVKPLPQRQGTTTILGGQ